MVEGKPISIGNVAYVLGMSSKKLHRWYQNVLSGFTEAVSEGEIGKDDIEDHTLGEVHRIRVPICKDENLGTQMAIDEKTINGTCYTILSNRQTNKIALMAATLKAQHLVDLLAKFDIDKRFKVSSLSRDMASNYDWFGRQVFMNAYHVVDKFHVIKNMLDQLQAIRISYRQEELARRRLAKQTKQPYSNNIMANGETLLQLLARSRGFLFTLKSKWSHQQLQRSQILFELYPDIKLAYDKVLKIRKWFTPPKGKTSYQKTIDKKTTQLISICKELEATSIEELKNIAHMLNKHSDQIINYFRSKETNAKAEALNRNLQRFINTNYGARNTDFFLFRVSKHFS